MLWSRFAPIFIMGRDGPRQKGFAHHAAFA